MTEREILHFCRFLFLDDVRKQPFKVSALVIHSIIGESEEEREEGDLLAFTRLACQVISHNTFTNKSTSLESSLPLTHLLHN